MSFLSRLFGIEKNRPEEIKRYINECKKQDLKKRIDEVEFVCFDTELTGLDYKKDSVISIGAVRMRGSRIYPGQSFYSLVKPTCELKPDGVVVHGITSDDLRDAPEPERVLLEFVRFIGGAVLVGHFVFIDRRFINSMMKRYFRIRLLNHVIDTFNIHEWLYDNDASFARHYRGMTVKKDLFSMARRYGILIEQSHNALYDAYLTAQLFQVFLGFLPESGIVSLEELLMIGKA